ncbi:MAG: hypothetical protein IJ506_03235 [Clostridia bacterium]|nr:hypothetical protein [Clostridia bacterium]
MNANPFRLNTKILKDCKIYSMLFRAARKRHVSFHTPGHKKGKWDITELSFSDNLSAPRGVLKRAQEEIAAILGANASFILTDGSTSGVLSMLYAARESGVRSIALSNQSHKSALNGCKLLGLEVLPENSPNADAVFLTSPDYYGNIPDLPAIAKACRESGKLLLIDGAHGGHLHFEKGIYAGTYADLWVDGVHKSLPAYTQGAVVSARTAELSEKLAEGVDIFRTTSPSYPIMASVEYAVKFPRNERLEAEVMRLFSEYPESLSFGGDWTKVCFKIGKRAFEVEKMLEADGIFAEFCDGKNVVFYLSPATTKKQFRVLKKTLKKYLPYAEKTVQPTPAPLFFEKTGATEWVEIAAAEGRICAKPCGLFPPCTPLLLCGEKITREKIRLLQTADNLFGVKEGKLCVYQTNEENE